MDWFGGFDLNWYWWGIRANWLPWAYRYFGWGYDE